MQLTAADIHQVVSHVWQEVCQKSVQPVPDEHGAPFLTAAYTTRMRVGGSWEGCILLHCSKPLAASAAAAMLGLPVEEVVEEDSREVLGEMLNIIAGNLFPYLPPDCEIGLPEIGEDAATVPLFVYIPPRLSCRL